MRRFLYLLANLFAAAVLVLLLIDPGRSLTPIFILRPWRGVLDCPVVSAAVVGAKKRLGHSPKPLRVVGVVLIAVVVVVMRVAVPFGVTPEWAKLEGVFG
jgi:hypothetical protein